MSRSPRLLAFVLCSLAALASAAPASAAPASAAPASATSGPGSTDFVARWFERARTAEAAGKLDDARAGYERVLERDQNHLGALAALVNVDRALKQTDEALWYADRFLEKWRHLKARPAELQKARDELARFVQEADPLRKRLELLRRDYVSRLLRLANEQMDHVAWHSARAILREAVATDPEHPELAAGLERITKEGGNELAVGDETGGADPLEGVSEDWVAKNDPLHAEWEKAWTLDTEHYSVRTNAGYRVLKTAAHAMEQVQVFYRQFHQYKTKGESIPKAGVLIFKNGEEYKTLGKQPVDWAAGHWDGTNVVTYDARSNNQGGLADLLQTLFHEASHQFTSLAGGSGVPAWLNEGMASFFEGTRLLSNGRLDWNLTAPGRLYPLVDDLRGPKPHVLADVIQGQVEDYRVYYPWGWGIVYYLYNAEDASGRLVYRALMREYFQEYATEKHLERFTEFFVTRAKVAGITTLDQFETAFKAWIVDLEAMDKGKVDAARRYEERADQQLALGDRARAIELYGRSLERDPGHPDVLWKLAAALEADKQGDRAAGVLRQWLAATALDLPAPGAPAAEGASALAKRREEALARCVKLDTSARRLAEMRVKFHADALALADEYDKAGLGYMCAMVLRGPATAEPPNAEAVRRYFLTCDKYKLALERWRLLFDELTLAGFYGGGEKDFEVENGAILAHIGVDADVAQKPSTGTKPASAGPKDREFAFRRLFVDERPSGDWSLSAELRLGADCRMAGLCFGKKQDGDFHGLVVLPEGYVDLARFGTDGKPLVRTKVPLAGEWHVLRLDVAGTRMVATLDGTEVLDFLFGSRAELAGDFGLLAGTGNSAFKEIKLLDFDPSLPRRTKIGRRAAAVALDAEKVERAPAGQKSYANQFPPLLRVDPWIGTPPKDGDLDRLRGWPVLVVFWSTYQEQHVPQLPGLAKLAEKHAALGIPILLVSDDEAATLERWLAEHPVPYPIGLNHVHKAFLDYAIAAVQLPHAKLIDAEGRVAWEGNPDWQAQFGSLLDEPFEELVKRGKLAELRAAEKAVEEAKAAFAKAEYARAWELAGPVAKLEVAHASVNAARDLLARLEREAEARLALSEELAKAGRTLQSVRAIEALARDFAASKTAASAAALLEKRTKSGAYQTARGLENKLHAAEQHLKANALDKARASIDGIVAKLDAKSDVWLAERARWLARELATAKDAHALLDAYAAAYGVR
ncbi:MAG: redoxin domain-containing protein [Planctomycetes bacterium]|nr:redoxin domain-containing protein [Planctomycetota bacterium]